MVKSRLQIRNVQNVAASKTALIDLPIGPRYHTIFLAHGYSAGTNTIAAAATNISEVRVKVNGRIQRRVSGTQLRDWNLLNGTAYDCTGLPNTSPGVTFPIYFAEPWRSDAADRDSLAWATSLWSSFQLEVDLGAASTPTLVAYAVVDALPGAAGAGIMKIIPFQVPAAGTSFDISQIDRRDWLESLQIYQDSGSSQQTSEVDIRLNSNIVDEFITPVRTALLQNNGMTPAASGRSSNITDVVMDHDDHLGSLLNLNGTRDLTVTLKAANAMSGTVTMLITRLGPPE